MGEKEKLDKHQKQLDDVTNACLFISFITFVAIVSGLFYYFITS